MNKNAKTHTEVGTEYPAHETEPGTAGNFPDIAVRFHTFSPEGVVRARGSINIGGCFAVKNVRLMLSQEKGFYLGMPGYKVGEDWKDHCFPTNGAFRQKMIDAAVAEYDKALGMAHQASQQNAGSATHDQESDDPFERTGNEAGHSEAYAAAPQGYDAGMAYM